MSETIIVMSAHSDDFVIGAGGTIANYIKEGKRVLAIVYSYGAKSHPWIKESEVKKFRELETYDASKILGCDTIFFDMNELKLKEDYKEQNLERQFLDILQREKPSRIFTHSFEDPHPDHKDVHKITMELVQKLKYKPEVYVYSVWNPVSFKTKFPALFVSIKDSYKKKTLALKAFKSQRYNAIYPLSLLILYRAIVNGIKLRTWFAEKFFRVL